MAERAALTEVVQIAPEVTEGTGVLATKRVSGTKVMFHSDISGKATRGSGHKADAFWSMAYEASKFNLSGDLNYTEIVYWLSSGLKLPTPTSGGATSKVWTFDPLLTDTDTTATFSLEHGQTARANRVVGARVDGMSFNFDRTNGATFTGTGIARALEDPFTLTALTGTNEIPLVPVLGQQLDVFLDTTWAGLGTTKLLRVDNATFNLANLWRPIRSINSAISGPSATVGGPQTTGGTIRQEANAAGMAALVQLRAGTPMFLRILGTGPLIETSHPYRFQIDAAINWSGWDFSEQDVEDIGYPFTVVSDPVSGFWFKIVVENLISSL